jgi:thiosulfate dehydrogenase [quinone] large subunit
MTLRGAGPESGPGEGRIQVATLVALRMLIGWHFLYEGIAKLTNPYWTSAGYLAEAQGLLKGLALRVAASPGAVTVVDYLNEFGLTAIGLGLLLGAFTRSSMVIGIVLLALYYVVAPPLPGYAYTMPSEGSYIIVNKVLIEAVALLVLLAFPASRQYSLDALLQGMREARAVPQPTATHPTEA